MGTLVGSAYVFLYGLFQLSINLYIALVNQGLYCHISIFNQDLYCYISMVN